MFQRSISEAEVEQVVNDGEIIEVYSDDKPYPSCLTLGYVMDEAIHVVFAKDGENYIIITVYKPSLEIWNDDMKTRR